MKTLLILLVCITVSLASVSRFRSFEFPFTYSTGTKFDQSVTKCKIVK